MSRFKEGMSIERLRERFLEDSALPPGEIELLYGRDVPRFMGQDARRRMRPTSRHLGSALYEDNKGRRYTPEYDNTSDVWWVSIPPRFARRFRKEGRDGDAPAPDALDEDGNAAWRDFPRPQEVVLLRRAIYARETDDGRRNAAGAFDVPYTIRATVSSLVMTRATASACVVFEAPLDSMPTHEQSAGLRHRANLDLESRRRERRGDRTYD